VNRIDALTVVGPDLFRDAPTIEQTVEASSALGTTGLVVAPGRPRDYHLPPANDALANACGDRPNIARLARIDPNQGVAAVDELLRCVQVLGCKGVFLQPGEECFAARRAVDVVRAAGTLEVPVVIAAGLYAQSEPLQLAELAAAAPGAMLIMTTGGQINISGLSMADAWTALTRHQNLHVLTNGEYRQDFIERLACELDANRVLFATYAPVFDRAFETARITNARLEPGVRRAVELENAQRLFRIG
jgi:predicted TIM-barrel fold metal-dependent hydrolase